MFRNPLRFAFFIVVCAAILSPSLAHARKILAPRACKEVIDDIVAGPLDPGAPGPFGVVLTQYGSANQNVDLPDFDDPVEFLAEVTYPEQRECGPFPIVFMMHGSHATCVDANNGISQKWPCDEGDVPLPNHQGYRYLAELLASHGIIAVSISANGINAAEPGNVQARARLFQRHIGHWTDIALGGGGALGNLFAKKVDLHRIGVMGHSRGGGAAARLVDLYEQSDALFDTIKSKGKSTDIKAVLLVGATEGTEEDNRITGTALGVVLPYCDGDQEDMPSVAHYDASRYAMAGDNGPKHSFEVIGANHNYFNTYWDPTETAINAVDDWFFGISNDEGPFCQADGNPDSGRLTSAAQRGTLKAIGGAFFRTYLLNEKAFRPFLRSEAPPPPSAMTDQIFVAYHPKDEPEARRDLNRLTEPSEAVAGTLGGAVTHADLERFDFCVAGEPGEPEACVTDGGGFSYLGSAPHGYFPDPANQLRLAWNTRGAPRLTTPRVVHELPPGSRDISAYRAFQFRAFVDFTDPLNPLDAPQDLRVVLRDGAGLSASVIASTYSRALFFPPPGDEAENDSLPIPRAIFNTVRVPLYAFPEVFLTDIRELELVFDQTPTGAINIADLAFADEASNTPPQLSCSIAEPLLTPTGDQLLNVGLGVTVADDKDNGLTPVVAVYSDEDDLDGSPPQASPDAKDIAPGTLRLRLENDSSGDGRVYLVVATATDSASELGHACCAAVVPAGGQQDDIDSVNAQAANALGQCTAFAAASDGVIPTPAGYFVVGDGPVIGPHQ